MSTEEKDATAERASEATAERTSTTFTKLAERGEGAIKRLGEELDKSPRVSDARDRLLQIEKSVLNRINIASADEADALRQEVARLEERLAKLEGGATRKKAPSAPEG